MGNLQFCSFKGKKSKFILIPANIHYTKDLRFDSFSYTGRVMQPLLVGWLSFVEVGIRTMSSSDEDGLF